VDPKTLPCDAKAARKLNKCRYTEALSEAETFITDKQNGRHPREHILRNVILSMLNRTLVTTALRVLRL
jgi:hypothetical protein